MHGLCRLTMNLRSTRVYEMNLWYINEINSVAGIYHKMIQINWILSIFHKLRRLRIRVHCMRKTIFDKLCIQLKAPTSTMALYNWIATWKTKIRIISLKVSINSIQKNGLHCSYSHAHVFFRSVATLCIKQSKRETETWRFQTLFFTPWSDPILFRAISYAIYWQVSVPKWSINITPA